jgi:hypothetical protein
MRWLASSSVRKRWYRDTLKPLRTPRISHQTFQSISMESRRQIKRWHGDGAAHLGFQEIWREWCGYTTAAGYTELPLPPPLLAPPRPMRMTKRRRHKRAGGSAPAHGEPSMAAEENSHSLKQECCGGRGEKGGGARFREDGSVEWSSWKWSPRSAGGDRSPRLKIQI